MAKKSEPRALQTKHAGRRKWLTFVRMCRYGINNFSRNTWLTIAATAVMTITLLIIFMTLAARQVLVDTVDQIKDKVDMSIYVKTDTSSEDARKIQAEIGKLSDVKSVKYISPSEARADFANQNKGDAQTLEALNEATNKLPGTFRVANLIISSRRTRSTKRMPTRIVLRRLAAIVAARSKTSAPQLALPRGLDLSRA